MAQFNFYLDQKHTIWYRNNFVVEADTFEDAKAQILKVCETNSSDLLSDEWETMYDTAEQITPDENGGEPTEEIHVEDSDVIVWTNKP